MTALFRHVSKMKRKEILVDRRAGRDNKGTRRNKDGQEKGQGDTRKGRRRDRKGDKKGQPGDIRENRRTTQNALQMQALSALKPCGLQTLTFLLLASRYASPNDDSC